MQRSSLFGTAFVLVVAALLAGAALGRQDLEGTGPGTYCEGKRSSLGCVPFVQAGLCGQASFSSPEPFNVLASDLIPNSYGVLMYGFAKSEAPFHGGRICVKSPRILWPPRLAEDIGFGACTGVVNVDFNRHIQSGADPFLTLNQTVYAQYRFRDPRDPAGHGDSLTDALAFTVGP
jgi:hypothetical protein